MGPCPLLLGKTWIWSEVSNYSFCNYLRKVVAEHAACGLGAWDGVCWRLRSCGLRGVHLGTSCGEGAGRSPKAKPSRRAVKLLSPSLSTLEAAGGRNFPSCSPPPHPLEASLAPPPRVAAGDSGELLRLGPPIPPARRGSSPALSRSGSLRRSGRAHAEGAGAQISKRLILI